MRNKRNYPRKPVTVPGFPGFTGFIVPGFIEKTLLDKGVHTSWATVREALDTHKIATIVLPTDSGETLKIRKSSIPTQEVARLYTLLDVPEQIIKPRKTWLPKHVKSENVVTKKIKKRL